MSKLQISKPRELTIGKTVISDDADCYVIAEIGHNHQGELDKARKLFEAAKMADVNAVKLQKRDNRTLYTKAGFNKPYDNENSFGATYGEHREFLEFGEPEYKDLQKQAATLGMDFFATAFDRPSADFLSALNPPAYKIASGDLKNIPHIKYVAGFGKPVIVSLGGGTIDDAKRVYDEIMPINPQLCFLHCTATYPTRAEDMNLRVIATLRDVFPDLVIGLSDHYNGIAMAVAAYVLGARIIEKHFTLDHTMKGTDHALSLESIGMHKMVRDLRRTRVALGDGRKRVLDAEGPAIKKMAKGIYAKADLPGGHVITEADLAFKSPAEGLPPSEMHKLIGRKLSKSVVEDEPLTLGHVS